MKANRNNFHSWVRPWPENSNNKVADNAFLTGNVRGTSGTEAQLGI